MRAFIPVITELHQNALQLLLDVEVPEVHISDLAVAKDRAIPGGSNIRTDVCQQAKRATGWLRQAAGERIRQIVEWGEPIEGVDPIGVLEKTVLPVAGTYCHADELAVRNTVAGSNDSL